MGLNTKLVGLHGSFGKKVVLEEREGVMGLERIREWELRIVVESFCFCFILFCCMHICTWTANDVICCCGRKNKSLPTVCVSTLFLVSFLSFFHPSRPQFLSSLPALCIYMYSIGM